jgi:hypothetical protein
MKGRPLARGTLHLQADHRLKSPAFDAVIPRHAYGPPTSLNFTDLTSPANLFRRASTQASDGDFENETDILRTW